MIPETRYARSGDLNIAYQVVGSGPFDLVYVPGLVSNVELAWEPAWIDRAAFFSRLASFARLFLFDKRGTGLSDRVDGVADLETRMDDVRAVMDAGGSERAAIVGVSEGGAMSILFAATYPERVGALVLYGVTPRALWAADFSWGTPRAEYERGIGEIESSWGTRESAIRALRALAAVDAPSEEMISQQMRYQRLSASPGAVRQLHLMNMEIDVRDALDAIRVPTLVINREDDDPGPARDVAKRIPGARYVELPGRAHLPYVEDAASVLEEVQRFLGETWSSSGGWGENEPERILATVLFTDIVGSTRTALALGDSAWRELLSRHHTAVRRELSRFRGLEIDTAGDGFFASFDGPARAIRCACSIREAVRDLGLEIRSGLHTGECELVDGKVAGIAVHTGARIASEAKAGEVLVSRTVRDLVAGSGISFTNRGARELKGLGEWHLYAVEPIG